MLNAGPIGRLEATRTSASRTKDRLHPHWVCAPCAAPVVDPEVYVQDSVPYDYLEELEPASKVAWHVVSFNDAPTCGRCVAPASLHAADFHVFHSGRAVDLVLRWTAGAYAPEPWWWDGATYAAAELTEDDERCVIRDAAIRRAAARLDAEGIYAAVDDIAAAADEAPGHRDLLVFVQPLLDAEAPELALEILDAYCDAHPEDRRALFLQDQAYAMAELD